jgi:hypothetical protein
VPAPWIVKAGWALLVVTTWGFVADGAAKNFVIENTDVAVRESRQGQSEAAVAALVLGVLALVVLRLGSRFPRTCLGLMGGSALVVLLTSGSELVLLTGLLSAVPVGVGVVLALVPAPRDVPAVGAVPT